MAKQVKIRLVRCHCCGDVTETKSPRFQVLCLGCKGHQACKYCGVYMKDRQSKTAVCAPCRTAISEQKRKDRERELTSKQCPWCLERFTAKNYAQVYCTPAHKDEMNKYKLKRKTQYEKAENHDKHHYPIDECATPRQDRARRCNGLFLKTHHKQTICHECARTKIEFALETPI